MGLTASAPTVVLATLVALVASAAFHELMSGHFMLPVACQAAYRLPEVVGMGASFRAALPLLPVEVSLLEALLPLGAVVG